VAFLLAEQQSGIVSAATRKPALTVAGIFKSLTGAANNPAFAIPDDNVSILELGLVADDVVFAIAYKLCFEHFGVSPDSLLPA
jgi:hypothetical protein